ncbi:hypothetical protein I3842_06G057500 [Carya illinoinensis]|uniref:Uncharacterized protein n=1 Tax=Carya illinoinensis TaxID=32201 RepID=A0A922EU69_CARIL|nr:hypothetical protein I3842_06G057500 [Carya illinoinensis]
MLYTNFHYKYTMPRMKPTNPVPCKHPTPILRSNHKLHWSVSVTTTTPRTRTFQIMCQD